MKVNLGMATELDGIVKGMRIDCDFLIKQAGKQGHRSGNIEKDPCPSWISCRAF